MPRTKFETGEFGLSVGRVLGGKYVIEERLGAGVEGEVFKVTEVLTGLHRAIKLYYPDTPNIKNVIARNAILMDKLRGCPLVIHYNSIETIRVKGETISCLISEYVDGERLAAFCNRFRGGRIPHFQALHIVYQLAEGIDFIHSSGEYHGDIHTDNVLIQPRGIFFDLKLVDFHYRGSAKGQGRLNDIFDLARLAYDITGGAPNYQKAPIILKEFCRGLRKDLIRKNFPTAGHILRHLENG